MKKIIVSLFVSVVFILSLASPVMSQNCPGVNSPKDNHLYLYFSSITDNLFPEWGAPDLNTSPLTAFNVADLGTGIGTTAQLRQRIFEVVVQDYCEFNVQVHLMTNWILPTVSNWQVVGIGSDSETVTIGGSTGVLFGIAQAVDFNDNDPQDYARVYGDSFALAYPATFSGANSTLNRWANAIGGTATHEAGHNYGLAHNDANPRPGTIEDSANHHIMATGSSGLTGEQRASLNRHFGDIEYSILAHNLGLSIKTLHNWDFINPNDENACSLRIKILSTATSLTINWFYDGIMSPWTNPTITPAGFTEVYHGTTYNVFYLDFSDPHAWGPNQTPGVVPPATTFHVGATFSQTNPVIVKEATLYDCHNGDELPLHPRLSGYDNGSIDFASGDLRVRFFNARADNPLILRNLTVMRVPRMININTMMANQRPMDMFDMPINVISTTRYDQDIILKDQVQVRVANLTDRRFVDNTYTSSRDCTIGFIPPMDGTMDVSEGEIDYCMNGTALSLFPSSYIYVTATVVDPEAYYWNPKEKRFVHGPLENQIFFQISGFVPDFNENGIDDLLDIRNETSTDKNKNGIPDEVEEKLREMQGSSTSHLIKQ